MLLFGESSRWRWPSVCLVSSNPHARLSKKTGDSDCPGKETWAIGNRETAFSLYVLLQFLFFFAVYRYLLLKNEKQIFILMKTVFFIKMYF